MRSRGGGRLIDERIRVFIDLDPTLDQEVTR
jgi:hypothetical protein